MREVNIDEEINKLGVTPRKPETVKIGDTVNCIDFDGFRSSLLVENTDEYGRGINLYWHQCGCEWEAHFYPYLSGHGDERFIIQ